MYRSTSCDPWRLKILTPAFYDFSSALSHFFVRWCWTYGKSILIPLKCWVKYLWNCISTQNLSWFHILMITVYRPSTFNDKGHDTGLLLVRVRVPRNLSAYLNNKVSSLCARLTTRPCPLLLSSAAIFNWLYRVYLAPVPFVRSIIQVGSSWSATGSSAFYLSFY